jgi:putative nucleotidyltransferase-like protein
MTSGGSAIWEGVDRIIGTVANLSDLRAHRIHLLAARRLRDLERELPRELLEAERRAAVATMAATVLLERARAAWDGPMLLFKGPEAASYYPDPTLRPYIDVDLLVPNPEEAQGALLSAGFEESEDPPWAFRFAGPGVDVFGDRHHLRPLRWPGLPLRVELHRRPSWPPWMATPFASADELFSVGVPSQAAVDGLLTLPRGHHALLLAAHSWVHSPLGRIGDLIDVAVVSAGVDQRELAHVAECWGLTRLWRTTIAAVDAVILRNGAAHNLALRTWARNLQSVRERTVLETHLERWTSCFWALPPGQALRVSASNVLIDLRPATHEPWSAKLGRMLRAIRNAFTSKSSHDAELGHEGRQLSLRRKRGGKRTSKFPWAR